MRNSMKRQRFEQTLPISSTGGPVWQSQILVQTNMPVDWIQAWASFGQSVPGAPDEPFTVRLQTMMQTLAVGSDDVARNHAAHKAKSALDAYTAWYEAFIATYERDLRAKTMARPGRVRQARVGFEKLRGIAKRIAINSDEQAAQFEHILKGYMQMGQYTTEPGAQGALIPVLVNDLIKSLSKADLIAERAPQTLTPTVRPALTVDAQHVIAA